VVEIVYLLLAGPSKKRGGVHSRKGEVPQKKTQTANDRERWGQKRNKRTYRGGTEEGNVGGDKLSLKKEKPKKTRKGRGYLGEGWGCCATLSKGNQKGGKKKKKPNSGPQGGERRRVRKKRWGKVSNPANRGRGHYFGGKKK